MKRYQVCIPVSLRDENSEYSFPPFIAVGFTVSADNKSEAFIHVQTALQKLINDAQANDLAIPRNEDEEIENPTR